MKSPFPGMDPYLELHWPGVHHRLVQYACDALQPRLPDDLRADIGERLVVETGETFLRRIEPDVAVTETDGWGSLASGGGGVAEATLAEPLVIELAELEVTEGFIEIRNAAGKLVTAIEFLSPTNKVPGDGSDKYRQKQREVIQARANLVEIDLVRAGGYALAAPEDKVPEPMRRDYLACITVSNFWGHRRHEPHPLPLRRALPALPIPLREKEPRIPLELQPLLNHAYEAGRYGRLLDYGRLLPLPLEGDAADWARALGRGDGGE